MASLSTLLLLEGASRLAEPALTPPVRVLPDAQPGKHPQLEAEAARARATLTMPPDPVSGWRAPSDGGLYRTNALGLRGAEVAPRTEGELRLLTLGDSSIWGWGVGEEQVFSSVAARELEETLSRPVRGINGGVPGHETAQTLATLLDLGERLDPDIVILGNLWSDVFLDQGQRREDLVDRVDPGGLSALYRLLRRALQPWLRARKVGFITDTDDLEEGSDRLLARYARNLRALVIAAQDLGARPLLLTLPAPLDQDPAPPPETVLQYRAVQRQLATDVNLPLVDGPAWFRDNGATLGHFLDQVHPSDAGHALLGRAVAHTVASDRP